jgi:TPP-dependent trihydroxycyclohexane-1,2-dione (THcHDO) dehydratase
VSTSRLTVGQAVVRFLAAWHAALGSARAARTAYEADRARQRSYL